MAINSSNVIPLLAASATICGNLRSLVFNLKLKASVPNKSPTEGANLYKRLKNKSSKSFVVIKGKLVFVVSIQEKTKL